MKKQKIIIEIFIDEEGDRYKFSKSIITNREGRLVVAVLEEIKLVITLGMIQNNKKEIKE